MNQRTKTVMMVFGLCHQLSEWIDFARDFGYMTQSFKQDSGILVRQCRSFLSKYGAVEDEVYEHSVQVSELFERIAKMDEEQIKRVIGLITKIERTPSKSVAEEEKC
jgi:hypothetical protein